MQQTAKKYVYEQPSQCKNQLMDISQIMVERLKAGYFVESFDYNMLLSNQFLTAHHRFKKSSSQSAYQ